MKKVCIVIFSRANFARIKSVILNLKKKKNIRLQIILGASAILDKYGDLLPILKQNKIKVDLKIYSIVEGENPLTMAKSTGLGIIELTSAFEKLKPDIVLTVADRFETIATAIAASYMNIPVAHTQGGEVTGSIDESVRHAITKLSHLHFPASFQSYKRVIKLGEKEENVFLTGCPSLDLINHKKLKLDQHFKTSLRFIGPEPDFTLNYVTVLQHPVTTEYNMEKKRINILLEAIYSLGIQCIWLWPNVDAGSDIISKAIRGFREKKKENKFTFVKNMPPEDFIKLISNTACFIGNSSSAIREGAYLGIPAVSVGNRQKSREHGNNVIFSDYNFMEIKKKILKQMKNKNIKKSNIFGDGNAGKKIAEILSKVDKINLQKKITF